jgi:hypothetical protein
MDSEVGAFGCSGIGDFDAAHPAIRSEMTRSERTTLLALEGVEQLTALGFDGVRGGLMLSHDESTGHEADH